MLLVYFHSELHKALAGNTDGECMHKKWKNLIVFFFFYFLISEGAVVHLLSLLVRVLLIHFSDWSVTGLGLCAFSNSSL